ncbi:nucleotidyltransferase domain-containing protein [Parasedimentitalea marina]|uniref:Nucleotidyltransferase domain-containing protein n=1 Tax=Parasedimentitalea marina TaxID=2483033 RepID=A0A3T0MXP7_9RHOB|nr:nucleotidyltransferase domain-containing protein [Parasedimentitalea marina]AZV76521.1 nucleotidyltransferase domain-containing protein [Parasedimentitalea marina]
MHHLELIETASQSLHTNPLIRAAFLTGSHSNGLADAYSDIDFLLVASDGASDEVAALWRDVVGQTGEIVLWRDRTPRPALINAIMDDWTRIDALILKPDQMGLQTQSGLKPLFDHDGIFDSLPIAPKTQGPNPARLRYQFEEFIKILGLLHLAAGRKEYINGVLGVFHLRNLLVDLLIEETGAPNRGGVLHLNRLITDEQKELLTSMPPAVPTLDAMITAHLAYAAAYLPRARRMAQRWNIEWPDRFEEVTWLQLGRSLSLERPYRVA